MFHLLLIDEKIFFSTTFASLLQRAGYRVSVAANLPQGKSIDQKDPADLVIVGIYLKGQDGRQYLSELTTNFAASRLIGLFPESDKGSPYYPLLRKELNPKNIFYKPFRTEDLLEAIDAKLTSLAGPVCP